MNSLNRRVVLLEAYQARRPADLSYLSDDELHLLIAKAMNEPNPAAFAASLKAMPDDQFKAFYERLAAEEKQWRRGR